MLLFLFLRQRQLQHPSCPSCPTVPASGAKVVRENFKMPCYVCSVGRREGSTGVSEGSTAVCLTAVEGSVACYTDMRGEPVWSQYAKLVRDTYSNGEQ